MKDSCPAHLHLLLHLPLLAGYITGPVALALDGKVRTIIINIRTGRCPHDNQHWMGRCYQNQNLYWGWMGRCHHNQQVTTSNNFLATVHCLGHGWHRERPTNFSMDLSGDLMMYHHHTITILSYYLHENPLWLHWRPVKVGCRSARSLDPSNNSQTCGNCLETFRLWIIYDYMMMIILWGALSYPAI